MLAPLFPFHQMVALIPGRLSFTVHQSESELVEQIRTRPDLFFFSTGIEESYQPFFDGDLGPINAGDVVEFCRTIRSLLDDKRLQGREIVYYSDPTPESFTNAVFLLGAYITLEHPEHAQDAERFCNKCKEFSAFMEYTQDPSKARTCTGVGVVDCLQGLQRAVDYGWLASNSFDSAQYAHGNNPENGDFHRVTDNLIACKGPCSNPSSDEFCAFIPSLPHYINMLKTAGVTCIIRLNSQDTYDKAAFHAAGIAHRDIPIQQQDAFSPPEEAINEFLEICDKTPGTVAVHCSNGLQRTGVMLAIWMMRRKNFSARAALGLLRVVRPGCGMGALRSLEKLQQGGWQQGDCVAKQRVCERVQDVCMSA
mmetsp:Transcript_42748/g.87376  ORF Transcript_42748/g.87376 Transcript_42748/m.87376 type:complete len:366 (+) Transcript_42748:115-1212(+)